MNEGKSSSSGAPPFQETASVTHEKGAKDITATTMRLAETLFDLEETFPNLPDLLQPHVFPSLKSRDVIVALDTNALLLPFEIRPGKLGSLEKVYATLKTEDRLIVPGRVLRVRPGSSFAKTKLS